MKSKILPRNLHEENRISWNAATIAHNSHKLIKQVSFVIAVIPYTRRNSSLLGDLNGKKLLHLQCNAGQDTLSLAKFGAIVTGVDISDTAIEFARQLSTDSGIAGKFIRADVLTGWMKRY